MKTFIFLLAVFYQEMMKNQLMDHYYMLLTPTSKNFAPTSSITSGWTLNNHFNIELFCNDNLYLNGKGYEKLSKLFIGKI